VVQRTIQQLSKKKDAMETWRLKAGLVQFDGGGERKGIVGIVVGMVGIEGIVVGMVGNGVFGSGGSVNVGRVG
jgi:hypothetical protein